MMPNDREAMLELVASYALGTLPAGDQPAVEAFIASDAEGRREFDELRASADLIGLAADQTLDARRSARMKTAVMRRVRSDQAPRSVAPARASALWGTVLAAAAAFAFALVSVIQNMGLRSDLADAQARLAALQTQLADEHRRVERDDRILADFGAADAKRYAVAYGSVLTRGSHVYLALTSLPALPRGKVYQAWTFARGSTTPLPGTTFTPSPGGVTLVPVSDDAAHVGAVAITVEPEGGSKAPTSKPAFIQPLS